MTKKCMATFQPQAWVNDFAVDIDGACEFDITAEVEKMGKEASLKLKDDDYPTDNLAIEAGVRGDHSGPFVVRVETAIRDYWGE